MGAGDIVINCVLRLRNTQNKIHNRSFTDKSSLSIWGFKSTVDYLKVTAGEHCHVYSLEGGH
jgi:hypothetical protein